LRNRIKLRVFVKGVIAFNQLLASLDAANARVTATLADKSESASHASARALNPLVYDPDCDEALQLDQWRDIVKETRTLPPTLAGRSLAPLQHARWLGPPLAAALLSDRGKARHHLPCLHEGLRAVPRQRRVESPAAPALPLQLEAITAAATTGLKDHDRWRGAHTLLARKLANRRSTSRLGDLLDYVISRPLVSAEMIARQLGISTTAARPHQDIRPARNDRPTTLPRLEHPLINLLSTVSGRGQPRERQRGAGRIVSIRRPMPIGAPWVAPRPRGAVLCPGPRLLGPPRLKNIGSQSQPKRGPYIGGHGTRQMGPACTWDPSP
jgi:hypothetical protein